MKKYIVAINGIGTAGKDTFCNFCIAEAPYLENFKVRSMSSVDLIKEAATLLGWDGRKNDEDRKFLSDLKDLSTAYNDGPFEYIMHEILESQHNLIFVHIREIEEIEKLKNAVIAMNHDDIDFMSVKVIRNVKELTNNTGDKGAIAEYAYDTYIDNNGTLEELKQKSQDFLGCILGLWELKEIQSQ